MVRIVMFDLGLTLIDAANQPFPGVTVALETIADFVTQDGAPLRSCLVSDFTMAAPPATPAKIAAIFEEYLAILERTGLRPLFEPVDHRITLSTHAGARKPDRRIFEKAVERLGAPPVPLSDCLLITEDAGHIHEVRSRFDMQALRFQQDFHHWAEAPELIADLVAPHQFANTVALVKANLAAHDFELLSAEPGEDAGTVHVHGQVWRPVSIPGFPELQDVDVAIPVEGNMSRKQTKKTSQQAARLAKPSEENAAETAAFVESLATHGQIAGPDSDPVTGPTHEIETGPKGKRRLVRKRFSAM